MADISQAKSDRRAREPQQVIDARRACDEELGRLDALEAAQTEPTLEQRLRWSLERYGKHDSGCEAAAPFFPRPLRLRLPQGARPIRRRF